MQKLRQQLQKDFTEAGEKIILSSLKQHLKDGLAPNNNPNTNEVPVLAQFEPLLIDAVNYGSIKTVKLLIDHGADVNIVNWIDPEIGYGSYVYRTPLLTAISKGNTELVQLLLENGVDTNRERDYYCMSPLMLAAYKGELKIVKLLFEYGACIDDEHSYLHWNALMFTIPNASLAVREYLLENGVKVLSLA